MSELLLKGFGTREEVLAAEGWVVGEEARHQLFMEPISFSAAEVVGWDVQVGPPGVHSHYMGAHTLPKGSHLSYWACPERNYFRGDGIQSSIEEHGGSILPHPYILDPNECMAEIKLRDHNHNEHTVLTLDQDALFNPMVERDIFRNTLVRDGDVVTVTSAEGKEVILTLEGHSIAGIRVEVPPAPDREISVTVDGETRVVIVPGDEEVTMSTLLAGRVGAEPITVTWDGKTEVMSRKRWWRQVVEGSSVVV